MSAERRKPHITVAQLLAVQVDSGVVKYEATFFYDIRYSGVKSLRIDVPQALAAEIRNQTTGVREKTIDPQPEGVAEGYVAWSFAGESEFNGQTVIKLAWERKLREAGDRQERRSGAAAPEADGCRSRLGADRALQGRDDRRAACRRAQGAAADRSRATT